jgi:hypothetical protein
LLLLFILDQTAGEGATSMLRGEEDLSQKSHMDVTSVKTEDNTIEGPRLHWLCKLGHRLYLVFLLNDENQTER